MSAPPLPDRMRPTTLDEVVGQTRWLGPEGSLRRMASVGPLRSIVLWGPPGCGKTTLARLLAEAAGAQFVPMSAVLDGVKQLREVIESLGGLDTRTPVVFVDEIHRWNKAQQDALLPHVERGVVVLIGATTENPSFELNAALRSRLQVVRLDPLSSDDVLALLERAVVHPRGLGRPAVSLDPAVLRLLADAAGGDGRRALMDLERIVADVPDGTHLDAADALLRLARADIRHDRSGEDHYDVLSALIKSMRGSDPDAGLYWLARLLEGGEDPVAIARRLVVFASEDVGNADPRGLSVATAAAAGVQLVGMPEARIVLAQAVTWLACSPKSKASYRGLGAASEDVRRHGALPVPFHLRNAPTQLLKEEGYGVGYIDPHGEPHGVANQLYLPEALRQARYYEPTAFGEEKTIRERLTWWAERRRR